MLWCELFRRAGLLGERLFNIGKGEAMKREYDFSKATRGQFYRTDVELVSPVHLEPQIVAYLSERANSKGVTLNALVNELLKKDIELIEAAK